MIFISFSSDFIPSMQWHTWFSKLMPGSCFSCHILHFCIPHCIPHSISSFHHIAWSCPWLIVSLLLVCLVWVEPGDEFANEEPVEFAFEDPVNSDNCAGNMIIPWNHYYLCYASLLTLLLCQCCDAYHLLASLPNCHVKPLTHLVLANRCLAMLPLCSAPLIALLVAGEDWSLFLVGTRIFVGISLYLLF